MSGIKWQIDNACLPHSTPISAPTLKPTLFATRMIICLSPASDEAINGKLPPSLILNLSQINSLRPIKLS